MLKRQKTAPTLTYPKPGERYEARLYDTRRNRWAVFDLMARVFIQAYGSKDRMQKMADDLNKAEAALARHGKLKP